MTTTLYTLKTVWSLEDGRIVTREKTRLSLEKGLDRKDDLLVHSPECIAAYLTPER